MHPTSGCTWGCDSPGTRIPLRLSHLPREQGRGAVGSGTDSTTAGCSTQLWSYGLEVLLSVAAGSEGGAHGR